MFFMNNMLIFNGDLLILYGNQINIVLFWICILINGRNRNLHIVKSNSRSRKRFLIFKYNVSNLILPLNSTSSKNVAVLVSKTVLNVGL